MEAFEICSASINGPPSIVVFDGKSNVPPVKLKLPELNTTELLVIAIWGVGESGCLILVVANVAIVDRLNSYLYYSITKVYLHTHAKQYRLLLLQKI